MKMIKAGIVGGAGYTGGEVLRLLLLHPDVTVSFVQSDSQNGKYIHEIHHDCFGLCDLKFTQDSDIDVDVLFICKGHGESKKFMQDHAIKKSVKIIDLSQDFRLQQNKHFNDREFIYGLPELNKEKIKNSDSIANPGCFATAIQLALLPLAMNNLLNSEIHINATTGSTGAGQSLSESTHFSWRNNNQSAYKEFGHQHEKEIIESLNNFDLPFNNNLSFIPQRGAFTRGIFALSYIDTESTAEEITSLYLNFYKDQPFVHLTPFQVDVKQVVNTNNCFINIQKIKNKLLITSAIDNLLKGAAGQAVQNMNLMFGLNEKTGLLLKPLTY